MNNETEKYLQDICFEENPQVLDDDRPDYFDVWIASQEPEDWLRHINTILPLAQETARREALRNVPVGFVRQWINEDLLKDGHRLVTDEDIQRFINIALTNNN